MALYVCVNSRNESVNGGGSVHNALAFFAISVLVCRNLWSILYMDEDANY